MRTLVSGKKLIRNITVAQFFFLQPKIIIRPLLSSLTRRADKISRMKTVFCTENIVANRTRLECGTAAWRRPPWSVRPLWCLILKRIALSWWKINTIMRLAIRRQGKNHLDKCARIVFLMCQNSFIKWKPCTLGQVTSMQCCGIVTIFYVSSSGSSSISRP